MGIPRAISIALLVFAVGALFAEIYVVIPYLRPFIGAPGSASFGTYLLGSVFALFTLLFLAISGFGGILVGFGSERHAETYFTPKMNTRLGRFVYDSTPQYGGYCLASAACGFSAIALMFAAAVGCGVVGFGIYGIFFATGAQEFVDGFWAVWDVLPTLLMVAGAIAIVALTLIYGYLTITRSKWYSSACPKRLH